MYVSLVPDPGYNHTYLEKNGIDGEWAMFRGEFGVTEDNRTVITWGGLASDIKGRGSSYAREGI